MMKDNPSIGIIGSGSWATALVKLLSENKTPIYWYFRSEETARSLIEEQHNPRYLTDVSLQVDKMNISNDINEVVRNATHLILVTPSAFLESELQKIEEDLSDKIIFSAVKGIIPESFLLVGEHLMQHYKVPIAHFGVITGPCHAEEVALERLSFLTIASATEEYAEYMAQQLKTKYIITNVSEDVIGTEYAAVLKNIYALAAGIAHGLGYGDNYQSVLMSNAIKEMKRFIKKRYKMKRNINDSAYLGDLLVTGYSLFSRNRTFGNMIGKGYTVNSAKSELNMIAEGYYAAKSAYTINKEQSKNQVKTPIINAVYKILYEGKNPKKTFLKLSGKLK